MKISELSVSFQESHATMLSNISLLLRLLQKFDLAITWDNQHLIFPPLLPSHLSLNTFVSPLCILIHLLILHFPVQPLSCFDHFLIECDQIQRQSSTTNESFEIHVITYEIFSEN